MRLYLPLLLALSATSVLASEDKPTVPENPETVQCRAVREVGSRIPKRVCKTNAEWAREAAAARQAMENRNRNSQCAGSGC